MSVQTAKIRTGLRPAGPSDVKGMARLVDLYARQGLLLPRSPADMLRRLDQFLVIEEEGRVQAMGSLWPSRDPHPGRGPRCSRPRPGA